MVRLFSKESTEATRALQVWQILIGMAHRRESTTYGKLARLMGYKAGQVIFDMLGHVSFYCVQNDLPPLTILVVNTKTGLHGEGLSTLVSHQTLNRDRERVFDHDWYAIFPPSPKELAAAFKRGMGAKKAGG